MIISNKVKTRLNKNNRDHYKELGYDVSLFDIIVDVNDLPRNSSLKIKVKCDYCGIEKETVYKSYMDSIEGGKKYACKKCFSEKYKESVFEKYGVENVSQLESVKNKKTKTVIENWGVDHFSKTNEFKEKIKLTSLEKWGVDHFSKTKGFKEKLKSTSMENWGFSSFFKTNEFKEKFKKSSLKNWGVDNPAKSDIIKDRIKKVNLEKWGVDSYTKSDEFKNKSKKTNLLKYKNEFYSKSDKYIKNTKIGQDENHIKYIDNSIHLFKCDCNKEHEFEIKADNYYNRVRENISLCTVCSPIGDFKSIKEKDLYEFIKSVYSDEIIQSYRDNLEIDIYLPKLKIGFEFNGLYYHSDKYRDKWYHLNKTKYFSERGIRVIHIWEDDWDNKRSIIISQIKNWLGLTENKIFARKCQVKEVKQSKITTKFLNENHIQGSANSNLKLGLYYEEELISLMTLDHYEGRKKMEVDGWNINRFCNKIDYNIIGGASKLLKYFLTNYNALRIISYADQDWSQGDLYEKLGFEKISKGDPDYKYIIEGKRIHKSKFRKSKTGISESKLDINKIWDCGKIKFEYKL